MIFKKCPNFISDVSNRSFTFLIIRISAVCVVSISNVVATIGRQSIIASGRASVVSGGVVSSVAVVVCGIARGIATVGAGWQNIIARGIATIGAGWQNTIARSIAGVVVWVARARARGVAGVVSGVPGPSVVVPTVAVVVLEVLDLMCRTNFVCIFLCLQSSSSLVFTQAVFSSSSVEATLVSTTSVSASTLPVAGRESATPPMTATMRRTIPSGDMAIVRTKAGTAGPADNGWNL